MRKILVISFLFIFSSSTLFAQLQNVVYSDIFESKALPFNSLVEKSGDELVEYGFKYDKSKNLYHIVHRSKQSRRNRFWLGDTSKYQDDYEIYIYMGEKKSAIIQIFFYQPLLFDAIKKWAYENRSDVYRLSENRSELVEFDYQDLLCRLVKRRVEKTTLFSETDIGLVANTMGGAIYSSTFIDANLSFGKDTYIQYIYTIFSSEKPQSKWLKKQQDKYLKNHNKRNKDREISSYL